MGKKIMEDNNKINKHNDDDDDDDDEIIHRDNERHRLEELERRAKRHKARDEKAAAAATAGGGVAGEKERKRREHAARILGAQHQQQRHHGSSSKKSKPPLTSRVGGSNHYSTSSSHHRPSSSSTTSAIVAAGGSSIFQSLFAERALGFSISFAFRNAPPRPPVGPIFVGLGLEGELQKWTKYKQQQQRQGDGYCNTSAGGRQQRTIIMGGSGMNAVEKNYQWKLHSDLLLWNGTLHRKVLPGCAMDYEGCYTTTALEGGTYKMIGKEKDEGNVYNVVVGGGEGKGGNYNNKITTTTTVTLPPEDEALLNWKGSMGDTAMEILTTKQDRARAAARLAISQGKVALSSFSRGGIGGGGGGTTTTTAGMTAGGMTTTISTLGSSTAATAFRLKKKHHLQSRILDEKIPNFMKKTTYLTNDTTSVHRFTSLASTQVQRAKDMDMAMKEKREKYNVGEMIEKGFREANTSTEANTTSTGTNDNKRKRIHPITKQEVYALWDVPLLPDVLTWGHTFTHVVMDNPPRNISNSNSSTSTAGTTATPKTTKKSMMVGSDRVKNPQQLLLNKAIVADVTRHESNARMECTVWVPSATTTTTNNNNNNNVTLATTTSAVLDSDGSKSNTPTTATPSNTIISYSAIQKYDLDVIPLRDPSLPPVHHVWTIYLNEMDEKKSYAGYHSIGSRVQLSLGRPVVVGGDGGYGGFGGGMMGTTNLTSSSTAKMMSSTTTSKVHRRNLNEREKQELEMKMTLVDVDLAEKYGL